MAVMKWIIEDSVAILIPITIPHKSPFFPFLNPNTKPINKDKEADKKIDSLLIRCLSISKKEIPISDKIFTIIKI